MFRNNKIFYIILVIGLVVSVFVTAERIHVESKNKMVDVVLDYTEISKLASQSEKDVTGWLAEFKKMGINQVGLSEESIHSLIEAGKPIKAKLMYDIIKDIHWKEKLPISFLQSIETVGFDENDILITINSKELYTFVKQGLFSRYDETRFITSNNQSEYYIYVDSYIEDTLYAPTMKYKDTSGDGFVEITEPTYSKFMYLSLGFDKEKVDIIENLGMYVIPRTVGYDGWNGAKFEQATIKEYQQLSTIPQYLLFAGSEIIGQDDGSKRIEGYIKKNDIKIGMIETTFQRENIEQAGLLNLVQNTGYKAVRTFTTWPYIQNRYQYYNYQGSEEIENTFFRAITERNIRLIYFKPFKAFKDNFIYITDVEEYQRMFESLEARISEHGISLGTASVMGPYKESLIKKILISIGAASGGMILLSAFIPLKEKFRYGLFGFVILSILGAFVYNAQLAALMAAFGASVIFPSLAIIYLLHRCKGYLLNTREDEKVKTIIQLGVKELVITSLISLCGALFTSSALAGINYFLEIDIFRGVKAAQILPILIFAMLYISSIGFKLEPKSIRINIQSIKDLLMANIKIWVVLVGIIVLAAGYIYMARTGHEAGVEPLQIEMVFRNFLEDHLLARPRNKEFLIAFPALMLTVYAVIRRLKWFPFILGLAAIIGQTSIVNTFMHLRTPVYMSLVRTLYSIVFGIILGVIYTILLEILVKFIQRVRGDR